MAEYIVPPASLNTGTAKGLDGRDETYPMPWDWFKANAMRFYFTDEQIITAAKPEFEYPIDQFTAHTGI